MATYVKGDAVANATSYELYEKVGTAYNLKATASEINFNLDNLNFEEGDHILVVKAKAEGYEDSDYSNEVTYTVESEEPILEYTTLGTTGAEVAIVNNYSDLDFVKGAFVSTAGGSTCTLTQDGNNTRATSVTQVLAITGGKTVKFSEVISGLKYAFIEFSDKPCTKANFTSNGQKAASWITENIVTQASTKYLAFNFNLSSGFSDEQMSLLKTAITIE